MLEGRSHTSTSNELSMRQRVGFPFVKWWHPDLLEAKRQGDRLAVARVLGVRDRRGLNDQPARALWSRSVLPGYLVYRAVAGGEAQGGKPAERRRRCVKPAVDKEPAHAVDTGKAANRLRRRLRKRAVVIG